MAVRKKTVVLWAVAAVALASFAGGAYFATHVEDFRSAARVTAKAAGTEEETSRASGRAPNPDALDVNSLELAERDVATVKPEVVASREFPVEKTAIGSIDFNQDMTVQVFTPYPGRIVQLSAQLGDEVQKGQVLFTIDSPDLVQASSTLISAASVLDLTSRNLARAKTLYGQGPGRNNNTSRRCRTSRRRKATCERPATRCASSARPTPRWTG